MGSRLDGGRLQFEKSLQIVERAENKQRAAGVAAFGRVGVKLNEVPRFGGSLRFRCGGFRDEAFFEFLLSASPTTLVSMFGTNSVALLAVTNRGWIRRSAGTAAYLTAVSY